ncbi:MAG: single-stranded-DNA-specific exonuclease RecJ [Clostridia bacterium]|nr:single-stranded-DNA-specific exonuclease RecJ [Clostridia bacterium]
MSYTSTEKIWDVRYSQDLTDADSAISIISDTLKVSRIFATLLYNRGYTTPTAAERFLKFEDDLLHDPYLMKDMDKAVERLSAALENKEKICIYGDYDVDGVTAVTTLYTYLKSFGADVSYHIPDRSTDGYGLSLSAVEKLARQSVELIITVDTGVTACEEAQFASRLGMDMIITDHHECRPEIPDAIAVVNPHRPDCPYPFKELAGVGVVFKLICAYEIMLCKKQGRDVLEGVREICNSYIDLVAIGTISDVMPLKDENRLIVKKGLSLIENTDRIGLSALIDAISAGTLTKSASQYPTQKKKRKITSGYVGFGIAPRINAAGRISKATKAVDLLLAESPKEAAALAEELCEINRQRQIEENRIAEQAYVKIDESFDPKNDRVIVVDDDNWHQGIIGIVSSKITEKYGRPSILITYDSSNSGFPSPGDVGKGSGRSIKGVNLVEALTSCADLLEKYGGHELAAGLSVTRSNVAELRARLNDYIRAGISLDKMRPVVEVDCSLTADEITLETASELYLLEPYGISNPTPVFMLEDAVIQKIIPVGTGKHTKLILSSGGKTVLAMYFGMAGINFEYIVGQRVDVLFNLDINEYQGVKSVQLIVQDMRPSYKLDCEIFAAKELYEALSQDESLAVPETVIPSREECAAVYTAVRKEFRSGKNTFTEPELLSLVNLYCAEAMDYTKLVYILKIFNELKICRVDADKADGISLFRFDIYNNPNKTNIEKSSILKKLRQRCRTRK